MEAQVPTFPQLWGLEQNLLGNGRHWFGQRAPRNSHNGCAVLWLITKLAAFVRTRKTTPLKSRQRTRKNSSTWRKQKRLSQPQCLSKTTCSYWCVAVGAALCHGSGNHRGTCNLCGAPRLQQTSSILIPPLSTRLWPRRNNGHGPLPGVGLRRSYCN